ncbi:MAG: SMC-Scp complex subunit ScpB [Candidatus Bathyarchaeia archaeon]
MSKSFEASKPTEKDEATSDREKLILMEAALYVAGRPLGLKTLGSVIKVRSKREVRRIAKMLMKEYKRRETALEILEVEGQRFVMQLKADYSMKVRRLAVNPLLSLGPLKTLSYIAYRQPVSQKQVIEVRGRHAYSHVKTLRDMGLIECEKDGRTSMIRTTDYFADYFGLSHDLKVMKRQLRRVFNKLMKKEQKQQQSPNR